MKKKTRKIITLTFAILLVILVQAMGITYAKYITTEKGNGQAEIARWSFEIVKDGQQKKNVNNYHILLCKLRFLPIYSM